jgi:CRP/FNR family cyclic AMP-dependent transcriptional regulator
VPQEPHPPARFLNDLTPEERDALERIGRPRTFNTGDVLVNQGDDSAYVIVIKEGWVKITSATSDGRLVLLAVRGPADLVGEGAVFRDSEQRFATVTALGRLETFVVLADRFTAFLDSHPRVARMLMTMMQRRWDESDRRAQARASAADGGLRLVDLLIELAEISLAYEPADPKGPIGISPPLSQSDLGSWADASRETAARQLRILREKKLVATGWRRLTVLDLDGLRAFAEERRRQLDNANRL